MSLPLFMMSLKKNGLLMLIFCGVLTMYTAVMISMYSPEDMQAILSMLELFPEDLMNAMGFSGLFTDLTGYLASWLYGLLMLGFPMVYAIILGNRLVAKTVDNGSFAYLLSTPNSRVRIIFTQGVYALASVVLLFAFLFGSGVLLCAVMFPGALDIGAYFRLNATTVLLNTAVMMICFFFSCLFGETKWSLSFGAGVPIVFLLMKMLGGVSDKAGILKEISIYGFYDPVKLAEGASAAGVNLIYAGITALLFAAGILIFKHKRLTL